MTLRSVPGSSADQDLMELLSLVSSLMNDLRTILSRWLDIEMGIDISNPHMRLKAEKVYSGGRGRPRYTIRLEQLLFLRELQFTWTKIAALYGIGRRTLYNIRAEFGMLVSAFSRFTSTSDSDLDAVVLDIKRQMPDAGQSLVKESFSLEVFVYLLRD